MARLICPPGKFFEPHTHICAPCKFLCHPGLQTYGECVKYCPEYVTTSERPEPQQTTRRPESLSSGIEKQQDFEPESSLESAFLPMSTLVLILITTYIVIIIVLYVKRIKHGDCRTIVVDIELGEEQHPNEPSNSSRQHCKRVTNVTKYTHETTTTRKIRQSNAAGDGFTKSCMCAPWCCQSKEEVPPDGTCAMLIGEETPMAGHTCSTFSGGTIESITEKSLVPQQESKESKLIPNTSIIPYNIGYFTIHTYDKVNYKTSISLTRNIDMKKTSIGQLSNEHADSDSGKGSSILSTEHNEDNLHPTDERKSGSNEHKAKNTNQEVSSIAPEVVMGEEQESPGDTECTRSGDPAESDVGGAYTCQQVSVEELSLRNTKCMGSGYATEHHTLLNRQTFSDARQHDAGYDQRQRVQTVLANRTAQQNRSVEEDASPVSDFVLDLREERPESDGAAVSTPSISSAEDSLSLDLRTGSAAGSGDFYAPQSEVASLASESNAEEVWANVMRVYDLMDGQQHRFPWVVGCMVSSDVLEVVVNLSGTTLTTDAAYDRLCDVIPQTLRQYLLFSVEADAPDPSETCVEE